MGLSLNDIKAKHWERSIGAANDITSGVACRVMAISLSAGAAAGDVQVFNNTTATGSDVIQVNAVAADHNMLYLGPNGTRFDTGLSVAVNGTPDNAVVFYVVE